MLQMVSNAATDPNQVGDVHAGKPPSGMDSCMDTAADGVVEKAAIPKVLISRKQSSIQMTGNGHAFASIVRQCGCYSSVGIFVGKSGFHFGGCVPPIAKPLLNG